MLEAEPVKGGEARQTEVETWPELQQVKLPGSLVELKRRHVNRVCAHVLERDHAMAVDCEGANRTALIHVIVMGASIGIAIVGLKEGEDERIRGLAYGCREALEETLPKPQK